MYIFTSLFFEKMLFTNYLTMRRIEKSDTMTLLVITQQIRLKRSRLNFAETQQ